MNLSIQPFGHIEDRVLNHLREELKPYFKKVVVKKQVPIPEESYSEYRKQYLVDDFMKVLKDVPGKKVLGVVDRDLYTPELNFIFGQARINGKQCIISLDRLREGVSRKWFLQRVAKEAVHELGHTFGLRHCQNRMCVMHFSNTLADTDIKTAGFCKKCEKQL